MRIHLDHQRWPLGIGRSQRRQRRRQHDAGIVSRVAKRFFIVVDYACHRYRRHHAHLVVDLLRMIGNLRLVHVERQRLLQPELDHGKSLVAIGRQSIELHQHHANCGVGHDGNHILGTPGNAAETPLQFLRAPRLRCRRLFSTRSGITLPGASSRAAEASSPSPLIGQPPSQHAVRGNFAGQLGFVDLRLYSFAGNACEKMLP